MKKVVVALIILGVVILGKYLYERNKVNIYVEFEKLRPIKGSINTYYNGYKIGKVTDFSPCPHSKNVCVGVLINNDKMFIPNNITFKMKQKKINERKYEDYLEIIYPKTPDYKEIKRGGIYKGELAAGFHNYLIEEVSYSEMEEAKIALLNSAVNLEKATSVLGDLLTSLDDIAQESKNSIKTSSSEFSKTAKNLSSITNKINSAIDRGNIKGIMENIEGSTFNLYETTDTIKKFSSDISDSSTHITGATSTIRNIAQCTLEIVQGINCKLKKPFGTLRLLFGKVID